MSKLYDTYISLKTNEKETENNLYLFKYGMFFICIAEDANKASQILNLKITNLNKDIVKCGFPIKSLDKYSNLLRLSNYTFKIVDTTKKEIFTANTYSINDNIKELLQNISTIDTENLSIKEAYSFLDTIKNKAILIMKGAENND